MTTLGVVLCVAVSLTLMRKSWRARQRAMDLPPGYRLVALEASLRSGRYAVAWSLLALALSVVAVLLG